MVPVAEQDVCPSSRPILFVNYQGLTFRVVCIAADILLETIIMTI